MRSLWAAGLLLRRLRTEPGIILLIFVLVAATSFVFAAAPRLFNRVSDDALRYAARVAPASQRNLALRPRLQPRRRARRAASPACAPTASSSRSSFPPSVAALISDRSLRVTTVRLYVPDPPSYETHISLRYQDGLTDATRLVSGRWPVDRGVPLRHVTVGIGSGVPDDGAQAEPVVLEAALSTAAAAEIGVHVGDRLAVTLDGSDLLVIGTSYQIAPTEIQVVGLYEPLDPNAEYWYGDAGLLQVSQRRERMSTRSPTPPPTSPPRCTPASGAAACRSTTSGASRSTHSVSTQARWPSCRSTCAASASSPASRRSRRPAPSWSSPACPGSSTGTPRSVPCPSRSCPLPPLARSGWPAAPWPWSPSCSSRRRRTTLALARGRGASGSLVLGTQLWEAILLAGGASLVGLLAAVSVFPARASPLSPALAVAVAVAAMLLLVGASWPTARRPLGQLERDDPPVLRVAPRRLVIEMTIVFVAVAANLLLRQRGLTRRRARQRRPLRSTACVRAGAERPGGGDRRRAPLPAAHPRPRLARGPDGATLSRCSASGRSDGSRPPRTCRCSCSC